MSNYKECLTEKEQVDYEFHLSVLNKIAKNNLEDAKICIKDGYYTLFAEDAKKAGYDILNVSKSYFDRSYDVFLKKRPKETNSWEQVRIQAAIAAMQGFCNICHDSVIREIQESSDKERSNVISFLAVRMADALVKELK